MKQPQTSGAAATGNFHAPSVPISVYRELAAELQFTKDQLGTLKTQNHQLIEQNHNLQVEIDRVVQSALKLQQVNNSFKLTQLPESIAPKLQLEHQFEVPPSAPKPTKKLRVKQGKRSAATRNPELTTEQPMNPSRRTPPQRAEVGGWWLVLVIFLIVATAFGTGFLLVRPLLPSR